MTSPRLNFELIGQKGSDRTSNRAEEQPRQAERPRLINDLAEGLEFLIAQLARAEEERDHARMDADRSKAESSKAISQVDELQRELQAAGQGATELRETRKTLENVISEQQKALMLSMALMQHLESEVGSLRTRMDAIETAPAAAKKPTLEMLAQISQLETHLKAALEESERLGEEIANHKMQPDPSAAIRAIEDQRDIARIEAASARTNLSIQSAELEARDVLISALERAIEQQRGSLQSLESRAGAFATRLEGLRESRVQPSEETGGVQSSRLARLLNGVKRVFSPSVKAADGAANVEDPGQ